MSWTPGSRTRRRRRCPGFPSGCPERPGPSHAAGEEDEFRPGQRRQKEEDWTHLDENRSWIKLVDVMWLGRKWVWFVLLYTTVPLKETQYNYIVYSCLCVFISYLLLDIMHVFMFIFHLFASLVCIFCCHVWSLCRHFVPTFGHHILIVVKFFDF